jgi:transposase
MAAVGVMLHGLAALVCKLCGKEDQETVQWTVSPTNGSCGSMPADWARGTDALIDGKAPGQQPKLNDAQRQALVGNVESGPIPAIHGVVRWRLFDLAQWLYAEFAVSLDETTVGRELKKLGYVKLTARPRHHAQDTEALEAFEKGALQPNWKKSAHASRKALR